MIKIIIFHCIGFCHLAISVNFLKGILHRGSFRGNPLKHYCKSILHSSTSQLTEVEQIFSHEATLNLIC